MSWSRTKLYCLVVRVYNIVTIVFNASHHGLNDKRSEKSLSTCCCYCPGNKQCTQFSCFLTRLATIIKLTKYVHAPMTAFPSLEKNFLQIRKQKDSNLITHSLVTVTVTLRVARVSGSGVNTRDIVYVLIIFLMVRLIFPRPPAPPRSAETEPAPCPSLPGVSISDWKWQKKGEVDGLITDRATRPVKENNW